MGLYRGQNQNKQPLWLYSQCKTVGKQCYYLHLVIFKIIFGLNKVHDKALARLSVSLYYYVQFLLTPFKSN